ncbi:MAG: hypothetical protein CSA62_02905 [Planctomycetota bacterium]|nr:MAG: hypothetical protein CSA62_02905 [Planctomycetota bacterium]
MRTLLAVLLITVTASSQSSIKAPPELFAEGARIAWIGDSITHACLYTRYLEDYAWTRYPRRSLEFLNAGVRGDQLSDGLRRLDEEIAAWRPNRALICFGSNSGSQRRFDPKIVSAYQHDLRKFVERALELESAPFLMSSPPYDAESIRLRKSVAGLAPFSRDYAATLRHLALVTRDFARKNKLPYIDLQEPLRAHLERLRFLNAGASLSSDGIHPGPAASALIAIEVLKQIGERGARMSITIRDSGALIHGGRELQRKRPIEEPINRRFLIQADVLPWPLPLEAREAVLLDEYYAERNRVQVRHTTLPHGIWELRVDGVPLISAASATWRQGLDIGLRLEHPDWQQALRLSAKNGLRNDQIRSGIRDIQEARRIAANTPGISKAVAEQREQARARMRQLQAKLPQLKERILAELQEIKALRSPQPHVYEWVRPRSK